MESVDIIKLLKEEQEQKDKARTNPQEENDLNLIFGYYDKYVKPKVDKLISKGKLHDDETTNYPFIINIIQKFLTIDKNYMFVDEEDFYIYPLLNKYYSQKGNDNLGILETKDKDFKNEVADTICEVLLVKQKTKAIRLYFKVYIEPILNELHNQDKIIYNMLSNDKTILETSEKVKTILSSFLGIISSDLILNNDDETPTDDMLKGLYLVLFTDDNIEAKKELAKGICEDFVNFYNENDFTQLSIEELQERLNNSLLISE